MPDLNKGGTNWMHPLVREWFVKKFNDATEPQKQGWPSILLGQPTLISAPTGSGKTFAAFLVCIDRLIRKGLDETLIDKTQILYVSPLKALGNDIQKNLMTPLIEISQLAALHKIKMTPITVAVRTGDTSAGDRLKMLKKPPHILITTPESLYLLLTAEKSRATLISINTVIVDEIHALANNKRGAHLALSLERLQAITSTLPVRIGLSATQKPMSKVAHFLTGNQTIPATIIDIGHAKGLELSIDIPITELGAVASNNQWDEIYDKIAELVKQNRSTLIFANTRRVAERAALHLSKRLGKDRVLAHHGSLSRKIRLHAETKLKEGELKVLVATASLELGIDIGTIDLVCQLGSPRSIAVMLQRIGRAGHWRGAISRGVLFATTRDELVECAALVYAIKQGNLDVLQIPFEPLDVLAQQIVATCATGDWLEDDLFAMVKRAYHYEHLTRKLFNEVISILSEGISATKGRYGAYLFRDQINGLVKARRNARLVAITNGGAIPFNSLFTVIAEPEGITVGTLDEDFAIESHRGDIILLGSTSWKINRIEGTKGRVLVEDAHGASPTVPFWLGEAPPRTKALSLDVSNLRHLLDKMIPADYTADNKSYTQTVTTWLQEHCRIHTYAAEQMINYLVQGRDLLGTIPTLQTVVAERFFDESGGMQLVIHSPFGAAINKAWGLALRKCFCRSFNFELQASATDNGINISLTEQHSFPLIDVFNFLNVKTIKKVLMQAVLQSPIFITRWRWVLSRSLALVRFRGGKKVAPNILRMIAEDLLAAVFPEAIACQDNLAGRDIAIPHHPLVDESLKEILSDVLDLEGLISLLEQLKDKQIQCVAVDTPTPSVFAHEILNANPYAFLDDAPLEERRARAVQMRQVLPERLKDLGKLDPLIIQHIQQQTWPDIRNADELHDILQTLIALPITRFPAFQNILQPFLQELQITGRAATTRWQETLFWYAIEQANNFHQIYPKVSLLELQDLPASNESNAAVGTREEAVLRLLRGWIFYLSPVTSKELSDIFALPHSEIEQIMVRIEANGLVLRGSYRPNMVQEWCERRQLARIHKLSLDKLREEIKPISKSQFIQWLLKWQHLAPKSQLKGEQGVLETVRQLQGLELAANAWEPEVFAKRVADYDSSWLDKLCLMGLIGWGRFSVPSQQKKVNTTIRPTSIAPITFYIREENQWLCSTCLTKEKPFLTHVAQAIYDFLTDFGASFFADITAGTGHLKAEVSQGLWELVAAGLATADSFDNLRALIDPHRRLKKKRRRISSYPLNLSGRWSLIKPAPLLDIDKRLELICWILLKRYGVVFRDLLIKEKIMPPWRVLLLGFRRLEDRGEIRGGHFVEGFIGEQFALPYALTSLRVFPKEALNKNYILPTYLFPLMDKSP